MSTTATKKTGFKESVKNTGTKVKNYASKKYQSAKEYGRKYKDDIRTAYDVGYSRGWDDAYDIPKRFGSKTAAAYGYKKGIKSRHKTDKYTKQYSRKGNKC
jgi:hypothetical protein